MIKKLVVWVWFAVVAAFSGEEVFSPEHLPEWHEAVPGYAGKYSFGIRVQKVHAAELPELAGDEEFVKTNPLVLKVVDVLPGGTGEAEGLKRGDVIISIDGKNAGENPGFPLDVMVQANAWDFPETVYSMTARVCQVREGKTQISDKIFRYGNYYGTSRIPYTDAPGASEFSAFVPGWWPMVQAELNKNDAGPDTVDLLQRLVNMDTYSDIYRLPLFRFLARNPFRIEAVADSVFNRVAKAANIPDALLATSAYLRNFQELAGPMKRIHFSGGDLNAHLDFIEEILNKCAELNKMAFADISDDEIAFILEHRAAILESFLNHHMLSYEPDVQSIRNTIRIMEILSRVKMDYLYEQAFTATSIVQHYFLESLINAAGERCNEPVVAERDTPYGKIVISGMGDNRHWDPCAVIIDLGGNDLYLNNQGGSIPKQVPTAIVVDLGGNDRYESNQPHTQGSGDMGVGFLFDMSGHDQYICISSGQGNSFAGIGLLSDAHGADTYRSMYFSQGTAFFGTGILVDTEGDDRYEGHQCCQAVGGVAGIGILDDINGNDFYYCKGSHASSYGTPGHFEGWGQGAGIGLRPYASGGIGLLCDQNGCDMMEGGGFVQGGGYYYGLGMLFNGGNDDDQYIGTRYAQGFAAHQAMGIFVEDGGNDRYSTTHGVAQGLSWDETVVLFVDKNGDDSYHGGDFFSLGASANNGLCIFHDINGEDTYDYTLGIEADLNTYHGGTSLSIVLDEGGKEDDYSARNNNTITSGGRHFLFIDK